MSEEEKAGGKKESEAHFAAASLIPEVYYDLIARVPAGTLLVLVALNYFLRSRGLAFPQISTWVSANSVSVLVAAVGMMGAGGLTGILISPVADLCRRLYWKRGWISVTERGPYREIDQKLKDLGVSFSNRSTWVSMSSTDFHSLDRWMYDYIQEHSERARALLPKLRAEADFCSYMAAAFLILPAIFLAANVASSISVAHAAISWSNWLGWCLVCWSATALMLYSGAYRTKRLLLRMLSMLWVCTRR
jgi:hypothetical protein